MKSAAEKLRIFHRNPPLHHSFSPSLLTKPFTTASTTPSSTSAALTDDEINQINNVVPRLCSSNHLKSAVLLISAALSTTNPPLNSLPISALTHRLATEPDLTLPMHLLNSLKYNPTSGNPNIIVPITKMLVSAFFRAGRPKSAVKVFQWMSRPDFPGGTPQDLELYAELVEGFCNYGMVLDSIRVLRLIASEKFVIGEIGTRVYRRLLREARVGEAVGLRAALSSYTVCSDGGTNELVSFLDQIIANWAD